jgi:hypothetical protein
LALRDTSKHHIVDEGIAKVYTTRSGRQKAQIRLAREYDEVVWLAVMLIFDGG